MARVLITAFGPYDSWAANSSWLAMTEITRELTSLSDVTTRLYPVNYHAMRDKLETDLRNEYDYSLHLGQAPGNAWVRLESIAVNIAGTAVGSAEECSPLVDDGPVAYKSQLPLADWAAALCQAGIPSKVSFHAGTHLSNATLYLTHYLSALHGKSIRSTFVHLPLDTEQVRTADEELPFLPRQKAAQAIRLILEQIKSP